MAPWELSFIKYGYFGQSSEKKGRGKKVHERTKVRLVRNHNGKRKEDKG
jgi:hypothetical protein